MGAIGAAGTDGSQFQWAIDRYHRIWGRDLPAELLHFAVVELSRCLAHYNWGYNACFRWQAEPALREIAGAAPMLLLNAEHDLLAEQDAWAQRLVPDAGLEIIPRLWVSLICGGRPSTCASWRRLCERCGTVRRPPEPSSRR